MAKACLSPSNHLPVFFAVKLSRLPTVDIEHVDLSALLQVSSLRAEVRTITIIRSNIAEIRETLKQLSSTGIATGITASASSSSPSSGTNSAPDNISPPQDTLTIPATSPLLISSNNSNGNSTLQNFADHARYCPQTNFASIPNAHRDKPISMTTIGKATRTKLVGEAEKKNVNLFVSRLELTTTVDGVQECVVEAFVNDDGV